MIKEIHDLPSMRLHHKFHIRFRQEHLDVG